MSKFSVFLVFFSSLVLGIRAQQSTATMEVLSLPSSPWKETRNLLDC